MADGSRGTNDGKDAPADAEDKDDALTLVKDDTRLRAQTGVGHGASTSKRSKTMDTGTDDPSVASVLTILTTYRMDLCSIDRRIQFVRYFKLFDLLGLHLTCKSIYAHALPSKCWYICVQWSRHLRRLSIYQESLEHVTIYRCPGLYDPTKVIQHLGSCTSLKAWHFEQTPRGVTNAYQTQLSSLIQADVSQLSQLKTFLQRQKRCVSATTCATVRVCSFSQTTRAYAFFHQVGVPRVSSLCLFVRVAP